MSKLESGLAEENWRAPLADNAQNAHAFLMRVFRATWRILRLTEHLLSGAVLALSMAGLRRIGLPVHGLPTVVQWWHRRACRILKVRFEVRGQPATDTALLVANHISWLDIPALGALSPCTFLSKSEIAGWPMIGWMSRIAGTLFIERGNHQSAAITGLIGQQLRQGRGVAFFPEGTTTDGRDVRRFHPRLFAAAKHAGVVLQPVALQYLENGRRCDVAPYINDDEFVPHLLRLMGQKRIDVRIAFLEPIVAGTADRKQLANQTRDAIRRAIGVAQDVT